jgi:hypothetical protein
MSDIASGKVEDRPPTCAMRSEDVALRLSIAVSVGGFIALTAGLRD